MAYSYYNAGDLIQKIFQESAHLVICEHSTNYMLQIEKFGFYILPYELIKDFDKLWNELWSIRSAIVLWQDNPVVMA